MLKDFKTYQEPCAKVRIGTKSKFIEFNSVNKVIIDENIKDLGDKAIITLPRNYKELAGKSILSYIKTGDPVTIWLGNDNEYVEEFSGFLQEIESSAPLILHVDDCFYPLKRNNFNTSFTSIELKDLLKLIAPGYQINCPDINLGSFQISNASSYTVLKSIQEQYGFYTYIRNNILTCQYAYDCRGLGNIHTYEFYKNVKANRLKYHRSEDVKVKIKAISNLRTGKKLTYECGSKNADASLRTLNFGPLTQLELKEVAEKFYKKLSFDGYSGSIIGFSRPLTHAGDTLKIIDSQESDREGSYLIDSVKITYDLSSGYDRENTLSFRV